VILEMLVPEVILEPKGTRASQELRETQAQVPRVILALQAQKEIAVLRLKVIQAPKAIPALRETPELAHRVTRGQRATLVQELRVTLEQRAIPELLETKEILASGPKETQVPRGIRASAHREILVSLVPRVIPAWALRGIRAPLVLKAILEPKGTLGFLGQREIPVFRAFKVIPASVEPRETQGPKGIPV